MKDRKSRRPHPGPRLTRALASPAPGPAAAKPPPYLAIVLALCALTLAVYSNSFDAGMILDNKGLLLQDPRIRAATGANLALIFSHSYSWPFGENGLYRPLTTLSYLFNYAILGDGDRPAGYHWVNLLLHM